MWGFDDISNAIAESAKVSIVEIVKMPIAEKVLIAEIAKMPTVEIAKAPVVCVKEVARMRATPEIKKEYVADVATSKLLEYIADIEKNGIKQQSSEWLVARKCGIGGSQISVVEGSNHYQDVEDLLNDKLGITKFQTSVKMMWGNLFEEVIKQVVEVDYMTVIYGEDIFIPHGILYYSPDGLAVIDGVPTLLEFKAPYSRIPGRNMPDLYIPQVKMGLDIIPVADSGLFAEAVFRRCTWDQLGNNSKFDRELQPKGYKRQIRAFSFIGFSGPALGGLSTLDVASCAEADFESILAEFMSKGLTAHYSKIVWVTDRAGDLVYDSTALADLTEERNAYATAHPGALILPWKLLGVGYHEITKSPGYLTPFMPKLKFITDGIKKYVVSAED